MFAALLAKLKPAGIAWVNIGDAYNTPVNWRYADRSYSTLGPDSSGLSADNSAYVKPRHRRRAFVEQDTGWLQYGNLLALPYRLVLGLCDDGWLFRGEVIWHKPNPMPEGRARRPHRHHESIYLFAREEGHSFRATPPVGSVWEFGGDTVAGAKHFSRFPAELPHRCIEAYGAPGQASSSSTRSADPAPPGSRHCAWGVPTSGSRSTPIKSTRPTSGSSSWPRLPMTIGSRPSRPLYSARCCKMDVCRVVPLPSLPPSPRVLCWPRAGTRRRRRSTR